jgi:hypothetical protein
VFPLEGVSRSGLDDLLEPVVQGPAVRRDRSEGFGHGERRALDEGIHLEALMPEPIDQILVSPVPGDVLEDLDQPGMVTLQVGQQLTGGGTVVSHDAPTFSSLGDRQEFKLSLAAILGQRDDSRLAGFH